MIDCFEFFSQIDNRGHVKARFDFGSGVGFLVIDDRKVNDGDWHHIHVERYGNYVAMVLDKKQALRKESYAPGTSAKININGHGIQIGAGLSHDGMMMKIFCLSCLILFQPYFSSKEY